MVNVIFDIWHRFSDVRRSYSIVRFVSYHNYEFSISTTMTHQFRESLWLYFYSKPKTRHTIKEHTLLMNISLFSFQSDVGYRQWIQLHNTSPLLGSLMCLWGHMATWSNLGHDFNTIWYKEALLYNTILFALDHNY